MQGAPPYALAIAAPEMNLSKLSAVPRALHKISRDVHSVSKGNFISRVEKA